MDNPKQKPAIILLWNVGLAANVLLKSIAITPAIPTYEMIIKNILGFS
jgi:hypothetical protein